ncbi:MULTISPECIES: fumarylacetoacetate hydrolase family protein [Actinomadura]|uniref:fumarylacetoacetate hydrolase family protein n=1 Tax=Actinomadura TaxID=1988 RepID=UPI0004652E62|nr:fumarylacetoacetate hydrolase family protein [Actinomadura madurae]SPT58347.1 Ureidoglycolate lyase [Actinomadura madurae]
MRFVTVRRPDGTTSAAELVDGAAKLFDAPDVGALIRLKAQGRDIAGTGELDANGLDLAPVVTAPGKIICVGANYRAHLAEMGVEAPDYPTLFAKYTESLIGPDDDITLPAMSQAMDWEAELAYVIGTEIRRGSEAEARDAIAGYTVTNDVTARDVQFRTMQWLQGKTFEGTNPLGPVLVTPGEVDHADDLAVTCTVNGEVMQSGRTSDMVFSPAAVVSYLSRILTLKPGDLILGGTPDGVGHARKPPVALEAQDVVVTTVESIGTLTNTCVRESSSTAGEARRGAAA